MIRKLSFLVLVPIVLAGCMTVTPYGPAMEGGGFGFSEQQIETNRYSVSFNGNSSTSRQSVENYLLYRAAELTVEAGHDYFIITENDTEAKKTYSVVSKYPKYGRRSYWVGPRENHYNYPYYSYGFDWSSSQETDVHEFTRYSAEAYITLHNGPKPVDDGNAFDARDVLSNLGAFVAKSNKEG